VVFTVPVRDRGTVSWSRRTFLGAAGGAGAAAVLSATGCTWLRPPPPDPPPDPLEPLLAGTRMLLDRYERALAAQPDLAGRLRPLWQAHADHAARLSELIGAPAATPPPSSWVTPGPTVPTDPADLLAALRAAEAEAEQAAALACLAAPPERTASLGAICAARATHQVVLS
jgi:hypothetical protein